jgi:hypothetical protein
VIVSQLAADLPWLGPTSALDWREKALTPQADGENATARGLLLERERPLGLKTNINSNTAMPRLFAMLLVSPLCGLCPVGSERAEIGGKINWHGPLEMMANHAYR